MRECPHSVRWEEKSPGENEGLREDGGFQNSKKNLKELFNVSSQRPK